MNKDWKGNKASTLSAIGARNYAQNERETNDYYATEPKAVRLLLEVEKFSPIIWECACGEGHLSKELKKAGYNVLSTDIINRGEECIREVDFLATSNEEFCDMDIITNPPYSKAQEFVEHAMEIITEGHKVAMFLKIQFLEGKKRKEMFKKYPPRTIYVSSSRLRCAMNGDFDRYAKTTAICYAWYIWEKGYTGDTVIKWIN